MQQVTIEVLEAEYPEKSFDERKFLKMSYR